MTTTSGTSAASEPARAAWPRTSGELLGAPSPAAWFEAAAANTAELLLDHANCEKKAASTALALMFAYPEDGALARQMSRLAREELRHFEQVQKLAGELGIGFRRLQPGRYAAGLRAELRTGEPGRRLDLLICGAFIEARSCERFERLWPLLPEPLSGFYRGLAESESRHFTLYLALAEDYARRTTQDIAARLRHFAAVEAGLATAPDPLFRFHSGSPA